MKEKTKYMNPYLAGFLLGLVLLATIYITGRGLGASGAIKSAVIATTQNVAPSHAESTPYIANYTKKNSGSPLKTWLVIEVIGVLIGGFISGAASNRLKFQWEHGPNSTKMKRLIFAVLGGALFGIGSQLGRGCTSGAALSGMAVLSFGGIITMLAIFGTGYMFAYFARKLWI